MPKVLEDLPDLGGHKTPHGKVRQVIPAQAVEAAAKVYYEASIGKEWAMLNNFQKPVVLSWMHLALEAAAPHMLAAAWDEGYDDAIDAFDGRNVSNPYRTPDAR